jgi:hypothetical protein
MHGGGQSSRVRRELERAIREVRRAESKCGGAVQADTLAKMTERALARSGVA